MVVVNSFGHLSVSVVWIHCVGAATGLLLVSLVPWRFHLYKSKVSGFKWLRIHWGHMACVHSQL